jgi:hypothetical protein
MQRGHQSCNEDDSVSNCQATMKAASTTFHSYSNLKAGSSTGADTGWPPRASGRTSQQGELFCSAPPGNAGRLQQVHKHNHDGRRQQGRKRGAAGRKTPLPHCPRRQTWGQWKQQQQQQQHKEGQTATVRVCSRVQDSAYVLSNRIRIQSKTSLGSQTAQVLDFERTSGEVADRGDGSVVLLVDLADVH